MTDSMNENQDYNLWDKIALGFHEFGNASLESNIESFQTEIPEILRIIANHYKETSPDAKHEIDTFEECANFIESCEIEPKEETYWETRDRLGLK